MAADVESSRSTSAPRAGVDPATASSQAPADDGGVAAYVAHLKASLARARVLLVELGEYGSHYGLARLDQAAFAVHRALIYAALGVMAAVIGLTALVYSTALLLGGLSTGLGILLGGRPWLGALIVGAVVVIGTGVGAYALGTSLIGKSRSALLAKYEERKRRQRQAFGRDVATAAETKLEPRKEAPRAG